MPARSDDLIVLRCEGHLPGNRWLDGNTKTGSVGLAPGTDIPFTGAWWRVHDAGQGSIRLECLGHYPGKRWLNGETAASAVSLAPAADFGTGTTWRMIVKASNFPVRLLETVRVGQLTGSKDPQGWALLNGDTRHWGVPGTDLGANTVHSDGRLYIFFGDVPRVGVDAPADSADLVTWTDAQKVLVHGGHHAVGYTFVLPHGGTSVQGQRDWRYCVKCGALFFDGYPDNKGACSTGDGGGFHLRPVMSGRYFDPFTVDGWIGILGQNETPTGAFSYGERAYVFIWVGPRDPATQAGSHLVSKLDPRQPGPYRHDFLFSRFGAARRGFFQVAPSVVRNADHPGLPSAEGDGLVIFGQGRNEDLLTDAVHLAWMPLRRPGGPVLADAHYYTGRPGRPWDRHADNAVALFALPDQYTSLSAAWLEGPQRWILLYAKTNARMAAIGPVVARIGTTPWTWSDEVEVFNPLREHAYGAYMHWPGVDDFHRLAPPHIDEPAHAYGAFLLNRFTEWAPSRRELDLYYLVSFFQPYQVQLLRSRLRLTHAASHRRLFYAGNGTTSVDSGLPLVGVFYGVAENGDLHWFRYSGRGEHDPLGSRNWHFNSGNPVGNGWQSFKHLLGCGDGVIMGVHENGDLLWYSYDGQGESDRSGTRGWHPSCGNAVGNGWLGFRHVFVAPRAGRPSSRLTIFAVAQNGDLLWYSYSGNGEHDPDGSRGWHPNSGNTIGNGWQNFRHLHASGHVIFGVHENGDLLWYQYDGDGEHDPTGHTGWHPNSGNAIGNGWHGFRHIFGGVTDVSEFGHVLYGVTQDRQMLWYKYVGQGEPDPSGHEGWVPNSGNPIGAGW
jgi:Tachylectin